jgi:hypothetical protein
MPGEPMRIVINSNGLLLLIGCGRQVRVDSMKVAVNPD